MARNIEIKARLVSVDALLPHAQEVAGGTPELIVQDDTFFRVPHGRMKPRELADGSAELIHYHRPDTAEAKASDYVRVPVPEPAVLREALARGCGVLGRVRKQRLLLQVDEGGFHTRIHLDRVHDLGDFIELEVVLRAGQTDADGSAVAEALMHRLAAAAAPRVTCSYLDLLAAARP